MNIKSSSGMIVRLAVLCVGLTGCGGGSDQPDLGAVSGTVFFEGEPLSGASVTFLPESGRPAMATTDAEGNYDLIYIRDERGTKVGLNKVKITTVDEGDEMEMEMEGDDVEQLISAPTREIVPPRYNARTELEADVKPGENTFDFHLEK